MVREAQPPPAHRGAGPALPAEEGKKQGESFPSRHVLSAAVITAVFFYAAPPLGPVLAVITLLIALVRVIGGVHFVKDVTAGALLGGALELAGLLCSLKISKFSLKNAKVPYPCGYGTFYSACFVSACGTRSATAYCMLSTSANARWR